MREVKTRINDERGSGQNGQLEGVSVHGSHGEEWKGKVNTTLSTEISRYSLWGLIKEATWPTDNKEKQDRTMAHWGAIQS